MFDIGWTEMLVIAIVTVVVVGPKDLPRMLRAFGRMTAKLRNMAGDFQKQFNDAMREAELDDIRQSIDSIRGLDPRTQIRKQLNPFEKAASDIRSELDSLKPSPAPSTPVTPHAAEPLKAGPVGLADETVFGESVPEPDKTAQAPGRKQPSRKKTNPPRPTTARSSRKAVAAAPAPAAKKASKPVAGPEAAPERKKASKKPAGSTK